MIIAVRAISRPSCGRFFGGVSAKVRIRAAWSTDMTPVFTASAMSGKFFNPRARATILFALLGVRRVVEVSHPAGPGKPSFSRLTRVSMSATRAMRRASSSWILWETSAASARSSLSLSCQISVVMDQVYRTGVRCAMMVQSKTIAVQKDSGYGTCQWSVVEARSPRRSHQTAILRRQELWNTAGSRVSASVIVVRVAQSIPTETTRQGPAVHNLPGRVSTPRVDVPVPAPARGRSIGSSTTPVARCGGSVPASRGVGGRRPSSRR